VKLRGVLQRPAPSRGGDATSESTGTPFLGIALVLVLGAFLRGAWLTADPPTLDGVGIVWHDEGAWAHNARNRALWGHWRTDEWNPVFIAPVYTLLEYGAFRELGVGTWQARIVSVGSGLLAVAALGIGLAATGGRRTALIGACLLATNYVFVMWNRAALMESTMTAFIVAAWAAYALAQSRPAWGLAAGIMATLAWFSKAAAAFFVSALVLDACMTMVVAFGPGTRWTPGTAARSDTARRAAAATLVGLGASALIVGASFVVPHWQDYRFYNWQMSVTRKPSYALGALLDRASWLPLVQGFFTRMWMVLVAACLATGGVVARWRRAGPAERLLVLWLLVGLLELVVHDSGNERRYVMLVPALIALAALLIGSARFRTAIPQGGRRRWLAVPLAMFLVYLTAGSLARWIFLPEVVAGHLRLAVRLAATVSVVGGTLIVWKWRTLALWLSRERVSTAGAVVLVSAVMAGDLGEFALWAFRRTDRNYLASVELGKRLPAGTLVQGKLANGLSLENHIRPVFVGRGFGNYADRTVRDDVRYVLTYVSPYVGYEGPVIRDVLAAYPHRAVVATFDVAETRSGHDRAALVDKFGAEEPGSAPAPALLPLSPER
jgi:4-amino-4-deoxy-L-arabinose transferase-like glycosyltransferase